MKDLASVALASSKCVPLSSCRGSSHTRCTLASLCLSVPPCTSTRRAASGRENCVVVINGCCNFHSQSESVAHNEERTQSHPSDRSRQTGRLDKTPVDFHLWPRTDLPEYTGRVDTTISRGVSSEVKIISGRNGVLKVHVEDQQFKAQK